MKMWIINLLLFMNLLCIKNWYGIWREKNKEIGEEKDDDDDDGDYYYYYEGKVKVLNIN